MLKINFTVKNPAFILQIPVSEYHLYTQKNVTIANVFVTPKFQTLTQHCPMKVILPLGWNSLLLLSCNFCFWINAIRCKIPMSVLHVSMGIFMLWILTRCSANIMKSGIHTDMHGTMPWWGAVLPIYLSVINLHSLFDCYARHFSRVLNWDMEAALRQSSVVFWYCLCLNTI